MRKLLRANFARLFRSKIFLLLILLSAAAAVAVRIEIYRSAEEGLDSAFFFVAAVIGVVMAVFCSLFVGTEYSDGAIRNKLIVGHSRSAVYLSNLIVCTAAGMLFLLTFWLASVALCIALPDAFVGGAGYLLLRIGLTVVLTAAFSALFVLLAMACQSKAIVAIISLLLALGMIFAASYISSALNEPEFYEDFVFTENGVRPSGEKQPNARYLRGFQRDIYKFLYDFLPACQAMRISKAFDEGPEPIFAAYSALIALAATAGGLVIFKKKNIR